MSTHVIYRDTTASPSGIHRVARSVGGEDWRRRLRVVLGVIWLLDGALQFQPFFFTKGFAHVYIDGAAAGQPDVVATPLHWLAGILVAAPWVNVFFALMQVVIGAALVSRRWVRPALVASIAWGLGVWYFGDGLGGVLSGHSTLLTGFPAAPLLYVVVSAGLWPSGAEAPIDDRRPPLWRRADDVLRRHGSATAVWSWLALWVAAAVFRVLPAQRSPGAVGQTLSSMASSAPGGVSSIDRMAGHLHGSGGLVAIGLLAAAELAIGAGVLRRGWRPWALGAGIALSAAFWVFGQNMGGLWLGTATDVNSAPLYILLAVVIATALAADRDQPARAVPSTAVERRAA